MMGMVRPSQPGDAESLAPRLRQADLDEIKASTGQEPLDALLSGERLSLQPLTAVRIDGDVEVPMAMFGCVRESESMGRIWLLGSDDIFSLRMAFARQSRAWFRHVSSPFSLVTNVVDMRNHVHVNWLRWCGCRFVGIVEHGVEKRPFLEFFWRKTT